MIGQLGVCSWSLQPKTPEALIGAMASTDIDRVQLALDPISRGDWDEDATVRGLRDAGIEIISGMMETVGEDYSTLETIKATGGVRPDSTWEDNLENAKRNADLAARLGLSLVTFHAGFLPHDPNDPERGRMLDRLRTIADVFAAKSVRVGLETGQESAETLEEVMQALNHPTCGVNFDPANMILYGMGDPIDALRKLAPRVVQVHIKDAIPAENPGSWGSEVPVGLGSVSWSAFFDIVRGMPDAVDLIVEREAGDQRVADVQAAKSCVERFIGAQ